MEVALKQGQEIVKLNVESRISIASWKNEWESQREKEVEINLIVEVLLEQ